MLDLARELHALGHEVKFYSYVPRSRAARFGLPEECHVSLLPYVFPLVAWQRFAPRLAPRLRERLMYFLLNAAVTMKLQPCDVFHCMSGIYVEAAQYARKRFGARIWLVRASRHILSQDEILTAIPGSERPSPLAIRRELAGYALADRIDIPSSHVEESFLRDDTAFAKLIRNPFGTDLKMFPLAAEKRPGDPITFLTVGHWSLRKGCDVLGEAIRRLGSVRLRHVGDILDLAFPNDTNLFEHHPRVPQWQLPEIYARADAFVLASQEEGLSYVIAQAVASGLPVICTDRTGGADLAHTPALKARITVVPHDNVEALIDAMASLRDRLCAGERFAPLTEDDLDTLTWRAYAVRYSKQLMDDFGGRELSVS